MCERIGRELWNLKIWETKPKDRRSKTERTESKGTDIYAHQGTAMSITTAKNNGDISEEKRTKKTQHLED